MSVEKQKTLEDTSAGTGSEPGTAKSVGKFSSLPVTSSTSGFIKQEEINKSVGLSESSVVVEDDEVDKKCGKMGDETLAAREWFKGLTAEERSCAAGIYDGAFLASFLAVAAPWSTTTTAAATTGGGAVTGVKAVDLDTMVSLEEFESRYIENQGRSASTLATEKPAALAAVKGQGVPKTKKVNKGAKKNVESTALRIEQKHSSLPFAKQFFDDAAVIFPSANKYVTGNEVDGPCLVFRPPFFERGEELFLALNNISSAHGKAQFLSFTADDTDDSLQWLRKLLGDKRDVQSVPLYVLLLARSEWAVWETFREWERRRTKSNGTRLLMQFPLGETFSYYRALNDLTLTLDSTTLSTIMAPLVNACQPPKKSLKLIGACQVENTILTPLSWLLMSAKKHKGSVDVFEAVDKAVDASLRRMKEHDSFSSLLNGANGNKVGAMEAATVPENQTDTSQHPKDAAELSEHKKKKKKLKKRKSKKGSYIESALTTPKKPVPSQDSLVSVSKDKAVVKTEIALGAKVGERVHENLVEKVDVSHARRDSHASAASDGSDSILDIGSKEKQLPSITETKKTEAISVSRHDGRVVVAPPAPQKSSSDVPAKAEGTDSTEGPHGHSDDGESWETVEVRNRGSRRKSSDRSHHGGSRHLHHSASTVGSLESHGGGLKKPKNRRTSAARKGSASRKMVREILFSVIDSAEEEARRKKQIIPSPPRPAAMNPWKKGPPGASQQLPSPRKDFASVVGGAAKSEKSMRDVVLGKSAVVQPRAAPTVAVSQKDRRLSCPVQASTVRETPKKVVGSPGKKSPAKQVKGEPGVTADQNTAPTYQETVSAFSAVSSPRVHSREICADKHDRASQSGSSSGDTDEAIQERGREVASKLDATGAPTPPLPTLLSPENVNSANSSVASSLEAPHAGRMHHHSKTAVDVDDVGYHLLDVCDRLSRDMSLFMSRRALALSARRRERGALLAALQDSVSSIWPGRCHVELYGSCATQLDLPASDLDVVVRGLDRNVDMMKASMRVPSVSQSNSCSSESIGPSMSMEESSVAEESQQQQQMKPQHSAAMYSMMPVHVNGERVMRLAADLEGQPWAVQVNAIPTATVPVIKILADPSRLSGTSSGGDWMAQHRHLAAQAAAAAGGKGQGQESVSDQEHLASRRDMHPQPTLLPWRGSDVMNGLLSLDVTFEGPEHGGIGSTEFSACAVAEACAESGLHPDATPFVQVVMVLKELLAQRKLNEPYSGGLSSYALLLLVLALVRERAVIRAEIERVERQKRAMAAAELNSIQAQASYSENISTPLPQRGQHHSNRRTAGAGTDDEKSNPNKTPQVANKKNAKNVEAMGKGPALPSAETSCSDKKPAPSSWANIAKAKNVGMTPRDKPQQKVSQNDAPKPNGPRKPSFADAVTRSSRAASTPAQPSTPDRTKPATTQQIESARKEEAKKSDDTIRKAVSSKKASSYADVPSTPLSAAPATSTAAPATSVNTTPSATTLESSLHAPQEYYPQGFNDVVEVLCSGDTTAGKLLMHFLLFYGQHFDAQSTAIDISGKHERDYADRAAPYSYVSPYIQRRAPGSIDPITGMLTVDPIVIYDPLEGAENNNVSRRCFAWSSVRWIFAQSYATLASAVERSATPPTTPGGGGKPTASARDGRGKTSSADFYNSEQTGDLMDPSSPLLRCLLSF